MKPANVFTKPSLTSVEERKTTVTDAHPAWRAFIHYCAELRHGEIETLKIQDGVPVLAEIVKKKVKFAP